MARKERNDVDYFPHKCTHGKGMTYMRKKYGNDGYVIWFLLLENLGKANYHYLDLDDDIQIMYLCGEMDVEEETLMSALDDLSRLGHLDKELWEDKIIWNQKFVDEIEDAYRKRKNECINRETLVFMLVSNGRLKDGKGRKKPLKGRKLSTKETSNGRSEVGRNPQSIVEDSIVEDSKLSSKELSIQNFLNWFNRKKQELYYKDNKGRFFKTLSDTAYKNLTKLRKSYSPQDFNTAIPNLFKNKWAIETNNLTPEHFLIMKNFERYLSTDNHNRVKGVKLKQDKVEH